MTPSAGIGPGESAAMATSVCWAFTALFFTAAARRIGAPRVNLVRLGMATLLLAGLVLASGAAAPLPAPQAGLLALSGLVGLALGDAAYFRALEILGARRGALTMSLAPVFAAVLSPLLLSETIGLLDGVGMAVTIGGVLWVQAEGDHGGEVSGHVGRGTLWGALGALGQAGGIVLTKAGLGQAPAGSALASWAGLAERTETAGIVLAGEPVAPIFGTLLRIGTAAACVLAVATFRREGPHVLEGLRDRRAVWLTFGGSVLGPVVGVWLSLEAVARTNAAIASTIFATSPVFVIPLVRVAHGHRASWRAWLGAIVAVGGVALLSLR